MSRSNAPLALSVVTLTNPDSVDDTFRNITQFDDRDFGFNHNQTWAAMPHALRGKLEPDRVAASFRKAPLRVQRCITALCRHGVAHPQNTMRFQDYPEAGLKTTSSIDWDPEISVRVKASCWYVSGGRVILPVLQPRKAALSTERLGVYLRLVRQAYCQGDWVDALVKVLDLSGDDEVRVLELGEDVLPHVSDATLARYVKTFVDAKKMADEKRKEKVKETPALPILELLKD